MADWHGYLGIENVGLNEAQRDTLITVLRSLGKADNSSAPQLRMQMRPRPDGQAAIFEAVFDEDDLTINQFKIWLGQIFGIPPETIFHRVQNLVYGPLVTFARPEDTDRLRFLLFGGVGATWEESRQACIAYLSTSGWDG